ncbi:MAG: helix-turn-helix transcriptional regulator [Clostridia bacterium]|nr:helix-turn-helix transcriptional regulator [Clostridia bacterium]
MNEENFIIKKFVNCFYARDKKGRKKEFINRKFACFIITLKGRICFTSKDKSIITSENCAVFLPQGLSYINECLEDAESIVLNFTTELQYNSPLELRAVSQKIAKECYDSIKKASASLSPSRNFIIMRELYSIGAELFFQNEKLSASDRILTDALEFMMANYHNAALTVDDVAKHCFISEIYLRKLFEKRLATTPFKKLIEIRMKKAYLLAKEKRPVKEIAEMVGYSAVYQFTRAYKKYHGFSPSDT